MTKHEFLYDHDIDSVVDLIKRHREFHGAEEPSQEDNSPSDKLEFVDPKEFF